jgi:predicted nucleic-acid-binding protein
VVVIDTNVLIRFLAQDDPAQTARAIQLIANEGVWVSMTVLLEAEWVMRRILGMKPTRILALLRAFVGM